MKRMAEILKKDDFRRVELLNLVTKNGSFKNLSDDQLILLDKLLKKKDYSNEKKAEKSKQKLLKQINIEIYKRNDTAIWKI
jgi:hypothetical protein